MDLSINRLWPINTPEIYKVFIEDSADGKMKSLPRVGATRATVMIFEEL